MPQIVKGLSLLCTVAHTSLRDHLQSFCFTSVDLNVYSGHEWYVLCIINIFNFIFVVIVYKCL